MSPYQFTQAGPSSFQFITEQGAVYVATFFDYEELFPNFSEFSNNVYSFTLDIIKDDIYKQRLDDKIGETVVAIFQKFFLAKENIVLYICDSADERHLARKRKFDFWFWKYNDGSILKEDGLAVVGNMEIYNSLLLHKHNKFADKIIDAFRMLNERADDK